MTATVAIAGSSGLIGSALVTALRTADHRVLRIVRRAPANASELHWDPDSGEFDAGALQRRRRRGQPVRHQHRAATLVGCVQAEPARQPHHPDRSAVHRGRRRGRRRARQRQRGRLLRRHQGSRGRRNRLGGNGFPGPAVRGLGGGHRAGPRRRHARGAGPHRRGAGRVRRCAAPVAAAVLGGPRSPPGQRPPVHVVDQPRGSGAGAAVRHRRRPAVRAGEPDRAGAGHQRRIHRGAGPGGQPAHPADDAGFRGARRARRVRRRDAC